MTWLVGLTLSGLAGYWLGRWAEADSWREARGTKRSGKRTYAVYEVRR